MGTLNDKPVCVQIDLGAMHTIVWSGLVPTPPAVAPTQTVVSFTGNKLTLPIIPIQLTVFGKTSDIIALVYDNCTVDVLLGRSFTDFSDILIKAKTLPQLFPISTSQQTRKALLEQKNPSRRWQ